MVNWDRLLAEAKAFFSSGLFYILLGGLIMYWGYHLSNDPFTHSAFVFLVVILGLALLLFGTGTTASGDGTSGRVKVAIAGGAGVLAMVLGFGVTLWHKELTEVFMRQRDYGVLELSIKKGVNPVPVDLNNFDAVAKYGEQPLPLWKTRQKIEILVPILAGAEGLESSVTVELTPKGGFQNYALSVEDPLTIYWSKEPIGRRLGINNEFLPVINKTIKTDSAQPVASETATGVQPPAPQIGGMAIKLD